MNTKLLRILALPVLLALLVTGCTVDDPSHPQDLQAPPLTGPFAAYVAIGNSLTAGFMDAGLMRTGQESSYPRLLATQLGFDDAGFSMPWIASPGIGSTKIDPTLVAGVLHFDGAAITPLGVTPIIDVPDLLANGSQLTPYHNQGVPGATLQDALRAYSKATSWDGGNSYFDFITRGGELFGSMPLQQTVVDFGQTTDPGNPVYHEVTFESASMTYQALATLGRLVNAAQPQPALVTMWLGNNDVLGGAIGGDPTTDNLTAPAVFATRFGDVLQLVAGGAIEATGMPATVIVGNIPNVTDIGYFITEDHFNAALTSLTGGTLTSWPGGYEETPARLTFSVLNWIAANPPATPIPTNYTLTDGELATVAAHVTAYNQAIAGITAAVNASGAAKIGLVDFNAILDAMPDAQKTHFLFILPAVGGDVDIAAATAFFSLDGIHPNNHGYGTVANAFIDAVNATAGTTLDHVDEGSMVWDPTYGSVGPGKAAGIPRLTPEAAAAAAAIWH